VAANGHTIAKVQFFSGNSLLAEAASAPYVASWNSVAAGSYVLTARVVYDAGSTAPSGASSVTVAKATDLPPPWQTALIGTVGATGSATISNGLYTVQGAGNINSSTDNFQFLFQDLSGDGEISSQISSLQSTGHNDLTGVMIRETLTSGSKYALMGMSPGGAIRWQRRSNTGSGSSSTKAGNGTSPNVWVRVTRTGNTLYGYKSTDGLNWTQVNSSTITMAPNIYIGLAVVSGSTTTLATSVFTNLTVVP